MNKLSQKPGEANSAPLVDADALKEQRPWRRKVLAMALVLGAGLVTVEACDAAKSAFDKHTADIIKDAEDWDLVEMLKSADVEKD